MEDEAGHAVTCVDDALERYTGCPGNLNQRTQKVTVRTSFRLHVIRIEPVEPLF